MPDLETIQQVGGTASLVLALTGLAIRWLVKDRERILALLDAANEDRMVQREKYAELLEKTVVDYRELVAAGNAALGDLTTELRVRNAKG